MKRISYLLTMILVFIMAITVDAKYRKYEVGDVIEFNGHYFVVIEDSGENSDKLKVIDGYNVYISNYEDMKTTCVDTIPDAGSTRSYKQLTNIKCVTDNAVLCYSNSDTCTPLNLPFETDDSVSLSYNENRETNIGYFIKNRLVDYYKNVTKLNNITVRLLTADEQIEIVRNYDMAQAGTLMNKYGSYNNSCGPVSYASDNGSIGEVITGEENYNWIYPSNAFWVNSLNYTAACFKDVEVGGSQNRISNIVANERSGVRPVLELDKKEFTYPVTTEVEGSGTLTVNEPESTYDLGDIIYINEREWMVLSQTDTEVRLIRTKPMSISNADEVSEACGINLTSSSFAGNLNSDTVSKIQCAISKFKYCKKSDTKCKYIYLPYNYDENDYTYDPSDAANVGHYIENELNAYLEEDFGLTNLRPTVMTIQEVNTLKDQYGRSTMFGSLPESIEDPEYPEQFVPGALYPVLFRKGFIKNYNSYQGTISTNYYNYVKPVVTVAKSDLPKIVKAGKTVKFETMPSEGYELSELKITTAEGETVTFSPTSLIKKTKGTYTFVMPASATNIYAKFIGIQKYNVTSITEELIVEEGLNRDEGDNVTLHILPRDGYKFDKVVYYDEENNIVEVEVTEQNGNYIVTVPNKNIVVEAKFIPLYKLTGTDVVIPVEEGTEGEKLKFTVNQKENYVVTGLRFYDGNGAKITPYYTYDDGVYTVIMPASNVRVEVDYHSEPEEKEETIHNVPKTGDDITRYFIVLVISLIVLFGSVKLLKTRYRKQEI